VVTLATSQTSTVFCGKSLIIRAFLMCDQMPNPAVERDCAKARSPSLLR
jgi:hypothetical protein